MSVILALDTSANSTGVAVAVEGGVAASSAIQKPYGHSENLFRQIEEVLEKAGLSKKHITGVAVTNGPGSFTGLRVGLSTAKGLAFGLGVKVAGVSTLAALREPLKEFDGFVAPMLDAKKGQVYASVYDAEGNLEIPGAAWHPAEFRHALKELKSPCLLVGSGLGAYHAVFEEGAPWGFTYAPSDQWHVSPEAVALLGTRLFEEDLAVAPEFLNAIYLRKSEAEENWKSGRGAV